MITAYKEFGAKYISLFHFYFKFATHSRSERNSLRMTLVNISSAKHQARFIKSLMETLSETGKLDETFWSAFFSKLGLDIKYPAEGLNIIQSLVRPIYQDAGFSEDVIENFLEKISEDLRKTGVENLDFDKIFQIFSNAGVELVGADSGTPPSMEMDPPKNYDDFIAQIKELVSDISGDEPKLLAKLYPMCIVQLWSHFETFLKDAASETLASTPAPSKGIHGRRFTKKKIWRNAKDFFEKELKCSIFPEEDEIIEGYKKTWHLEPQFDEHPHIKTHILIDSWARLEDLYAIRCAFAHADGKYRGKQIRLTEEYTRFVFTFVKLMATHLTCQLVEYDDEAKSKKLNKTKDRENE